MPETADIDFRGRTVALDFDGVLHAYTSGWTGPTPTDPPNPGAQEFCRKLLAHGAKLVVYSTRCDNEEGAAATRAWLARYRFPDMDVTCEKPKAIAYLDDRAVAFTGDWAASFMAIVRLRSQPVIDIVQSSYPSFPTYHDLHITTPDIPRTRIFDLPYGIEVSCNRVGGWTVWDMNQIYAPGRIRPSRGVQIAGEYHDKWLVLDVNGVVILDSRRISEEVRAEQATEVEIETGRVDYLGD